MHDKSKPQKVAQDLERMLVGGRWRIGDQLPGERELAAECAVSYVTMRKAVEELVEKGLVERRHGTGTFVVGDSLTGNIGVILAPPSGEQAARPFLGTLLDQLRHAFHENGRKLRHYLFFGEGPMSSEPCHAQLLEDARHGRMRAVIMEPVMHKEEIERFHKEICPVVIMSATAFNVHTLHIDFTSMARDGVMALAALNCQKIIFLDPYADFSPFPGRTMLSNGAKGFHEGIRIVGKKSESHAVLPLNEASVEDVVRTLRGTDFDALLIGDDVWGKMVLDLLLLDGRVPGKDFSAAILANKGSPILRPYERQLIQLMVDPLEIATTMLEIATQAPATPRTDYVRRSVKASIVYGKNVGA